MECIRGNASATPRLIQMTHVWRYQIVFEGCMKMIMAESRWESVCGIMGQAGQFKSYSAFVFQSIVTRFVSTCFLVCFWLFWNFSWSAIRCPVTLMVEIVRIGRHLIVTAFQQEPANRLIAFIFSTTVGAMLTATLLVVSLMVETARKIRWVFSSVLLWLVFNGNGRKSWNSVGHCRW